MDLGTEPLLSPAEEAVLAHSIEAGVLAADALAGGHRPVGASRDELAILVEWGEQARQRFLRANLRLVAMVARQVSIRSGQPEGELFQEGCLGLIVAVHRFDHVRGLRFSTYALSWIRAYVGAAASSAFGALNLPTSRAEELRGLHGLEGELSQVLGRAPSTAELARALGRSEQWVVAAASYVAPQSLEVVDLDRLADDSVEGAVLAAQRPGRELLAQLGDLDRQVLEVRFGFRDGLPHTYAETARWLAVSVDRVRRAEQRALEQLRAVCPVHARVHL